MDGNKFGRNNFGGNILAEKMDNFFKILAEKILAKKFWEKILKFLWTIFQNIIFIFKFFLNKWPKIYHQKYPKKTLNIIKKHKTRIFIIMEKIFRQKTLNGQIVDRTISDTNCYII